MSYYKDVFVLLCLFIFLSSANSLRRQVTDDFITKWRPKEEAEPVRDLDNGGLNLINTEISSSSDSDSRVKGLRDHPPSSYSLKLDSFTTLLNSVYAERYESRPFTVGGFNWTLVVYPKGNKNENGTGFISMYVEIDKSNLVAPDQQVYADLTFYIYNNIETKYFTLQDSDVWRFNASKTMWGFSQVISIDTFTDLNNGYLFDDDHCEFGVDVIIPSLYEKSEKFNITQDFENPIFIWEIENFPTYLDHYYIIKDFYLGGKHWELLIFPRGGQGEEDEFFGFFIQLGQQEILKLKPYERIYAYILLGVLNQRESNNEEKLISMWFDVENTGWGYYDFVRVSDLLDPNKGFLVNDVLRVQANFLAVSTTVYFPDEP